MHRIIHKPLPSIASSPLSSSCHCSSQTKYYSRSLSHYQYHTTTATSTATATAGSSTPIHSNHMNRRCHPKLLPTSSFRLQTSHDVMLSSNNSHCLSDNVHIASLLFLNHRFHTGTTCTAAACSIVGVNNNHYIQDNNTIRLSKLISQKGDNMQMSRKSAESIIADGQVTVAGKVVTNPNFRIAIEGDEDDLIHSIKVAGRHFKYSYDNNHSNTNFGSDGGDNDVNQDNTNAVTCRTTKPSTTSQSPSPTSKTRVWLAHKLKGELVAEHDPYGRPSLIERLYRGGVGKPKKKTSKNQNNKIHLKPIGRLDMMTEGLILITNDGLYAHTMTLPSNQIHRTYRVRVHGHITQLKLKAIRNGVTIDNIHYKGMKVQLELTKSSSRIKGGNTNTWLRITCTEGKNRMIKKVLDHLGLQVTRLIRISFGDYDLNTIPPGMAIEVPVKPLEKQKRKGMDLFRNHTLNYNKNNEKDKKKGNKSQVAGTSSSSLSTFNPSASTNHVTWVRY